MINNLHKLARWRAPLLKDLHHDRPKSRPAQRNFEASPSAEHRENDLDTLLAATAVERILARPSSLEKDDSAKIRPGDIVAGRFQVVEQLGSGGTSMVFRAFDSVIGEPVALKFINPDMPLSRQRLIREVRMARQIYHPNVCQIFGIIRYGRQFCLSMAFVAGQDLATLLRQAGRFPPDRVFELGSRICQGVSAAHERGILHCDLKPSNILIDRNGDPHITDFGIAVARTEARKACCPAGTPAYMAPEQLLKSEKASIQSDVYAIGAILYELIAGRTPFSEASLLDFTERKQRRLVGLACLAPGVPPALEAAVLHALAHNPADRPESAAALARALTMKSRTYRRPSDLPVILSGERRPLTILAVGMMHPPDHTATAWPGPNIASIKELFERIASIICDHGGRPAVFSDDGLLAYFGLPAVREADPEYAIRAAHRILRHCAIGRKSIQVRIGIHTAEAILDMTPTRGDVIAFGETAETARALCASADANAALVSETTLQLSRKIFSPLGENPVDVPSLRIGGVKAFLLAASQNRGVAASEQLPGNPYFVGRSAEMAFLDNHWEDALEWSGRAVQITGEAGIGKTALIRSFQEKISGSPHCWTTIPCTPGDELAELDPVIRMLRTLLDLKRCATIAEVQTTVESAFQHAGLNPRTAAAIVTPLLATKPMMENRQMFSDLRVRQQALEMLAHYLLAPADHVPLVIACEDLQWCDPLTLELLQKITHRLQNRRVMLITSARKRVPLSRADQKPIQQVRLNPLRVNDAQRLVDRLAHPGRLPPEAVTGIVDNAGGVPLFIEELVWSGHPCGQYRKSTPTTIPIRLSGLLMARLDRTGKAKHIAQLGACIGRRFSEGLIWDISGRDVAAVNRDLYRLVEHGVLKRVFASPSPGYAFSHPLLAAAAYFSFPADHRREAHAAIAWILSHAKSDVLENQPEVIAEQIALAGLTPNPE